MRTHHLIYRYNLLSTKPMKQVINYKIISECRVETRMTRRSRTQETFIFFNSAQRDLGSLRGA